MTKGRVSIVPFVRRLGPRLKGNSPRRGPRYVVARTAPVISAVTEWKRRPRNRNPKSSKKDVVPFGCEGPCKVESFSDRYEVKHTGTVCCLSQISRGNGLKQRIGKRITIKSIYLLGKVWLDGSNRISNHTNVCIFFVVRDRRPSVTPINFGSLFDMFDGEPATASVKSDHRDRFQVLYRFQVSVSGGQYSSRDQTVFQKFVNLNHRVVFDNQDDGVYGNHDQNALLVYMACCHSTNWLYSSMKAKVYFYDSAMN
ncbi:capsid protein [Polygala garcinii associated virus]|uniref:Capsid protein n=1 Tax=Polygala garcinii associated virus TaxID=2093274 RepID=A0A2I8B2L3_9GEMI|nr:capsid protein [Polygala garcinii associated virus]AUT11870.1 capsid protein [Polygala garcinii associated virus]